MKTPLAGFAILSLLSAQSDRPRADQPSARADKNSQIAHQHLLAKRKQGRIDIYFEGDSITRRWGATDYPRLLENWNKNFHGWNAADFGWGADRVENILWRLENGELDDVNPKVIVLLAGTNNVVDALTNVVTNDVTEGLAAILRVMRAKAPDAVVILMGIFPRGDHIALIPEIDAINANLAKMADGGKIRYLNINEKLGDGTLNAVDKLHPTLEGYQVWADALKPILEELLGPPGTEDRAPPPTGDPSAR